MRTACILIMVSVSLFWTVQGKPAKQEEKKWPETKEEQLDFLQNQMRQGMAPVKGRPFTAKQQAWFDSLGVRDPLRESTKNIKIRREVRQLSDEEWAAYYQAVQELNNQYPDPDDDRTMWLLFSEAHNPIASAAAHFGSAFVVWHREFTWRLERALQMVNPDLAQPYWDTTLDSGLPDPKDSIFYSEYFYGNGDGQVVTGPFANFQTLPHCTDDTEYTAIYRNTSFLPLPMRQTILFTEEKILESLDATHYANFSYSGSVFESYHGGPHSHTGGLMGTVVPCAPSDPIFFAHHSFIDWVFQEFRETSQVSDLETEYPTPEEVDVGGPIHEAYADMAPFPGLYNIYGLSTHYINYYYNYAPRHYTSCETSADCTSKYLWCDVTAGRCRSKIQHGGVCTGLTDETCYGDNYACVNDVCTQTEAVENLV